MIYNYDEVKEFFGDDCFRMSLVRGAVIFENEDIFNETVVGTTFRVGRFIFYCHDKTNKYVIGSFAC